MRSLITLIALIFGFSAGVSAQALIPSFGKARSGTSGFQFTKITVDARAAAMGNSSVADAIDASSLYWNPAMAVQIGRNEFMAGYTSYFVGVNQGYFAYVHQLKKYNLALGASLQYLDSGEIDETTEFRPGGTGRTFSTVHYSLGLTASQRLTELFSYGMTVRLLDERFEEVQVQTVAFDFGFYYVVGETGLRFAVGVNNFSFDGTPTGSTTRQALDSTITENQFEAITPPTNFLIGAAYNVWKNDNMGVLLTAQLTKPSDNAERLALGAEYQFMNKFFFRTGYEFGVEELMWPSVGFGLNTSWDGRALGIDMSYTAYERLGNLPRFALKFGF
jgi:hypothetical protein